MGYSLEVTVDIKEDGKDYHKSSQVSYNLSRESLIEMETDLKKVQKKWDEAAGIKI